MLNHKFVRHLLVFVAVFTLGTGIVLADPPPKAVSGTFQTQSFSGDGCNSPIDLCSSGIATGDLAGDVFVSITTSVVNVGADGVPFSDYTGTISITANNGTISGTIAGSINLLTGELNSTVNLTEGTKKYKKRTGTLSVNGVFDLATGAEFDNYAGTIQVNP
ncbi:MAG: hypothetical protein AAF125_17255 [Chloroflexota bacterium]